MANNGNLKPFKKGQSGNPKGKQKKLVGYTITMLESEGYAQVTAGQVKQVYTLLITLTEERLKVLTADPETPMLYRIVAKKILSKEGFETVEQMLDRAHGKATQPIEGAIQPPTINIIMPNE